VKTLKQLGRTEYESNTQIILRTSALFRISALHQRSWTYMSWLIFGVALKIANCLTRFREHIGRTTAPTFVRIYNDAGTRPWKRNISCPLLFCCHRRHGPRCYYSDK